MRDGTNAKLQRELAARDGELAAATQQLAALRAEAHDLRRVSRRESVNMEYLKNILVQFMSFPSGSSEHASLTPVLATLLQVGVRCVRDEREREISTFYIHLRVEEREGDGCGGGGGGGASSRGRRADGARGGGCCG